MTTDLADLLPCPAGRTDVWETVTAAEGLLTDRMGAQVELADPEDLGGSIRSVVLRVRVVRNPFSLPRTLVVKHTTAAAPENSGTPSPARRPAASCSPRCTRTTGPGPP